MSWFSRLRNVFRADDLSRDVEREMAFHLEERANDLIAQGVPPDEARRQARKRLGSYSVLKERTRDFDLFVKLETLIADLRYAVRGLRAAPAFSFVAVLSLALGIGANTTIFTFVNAVLLKPLPYPQADRLVVIREQQVGSANTVGVHPVNFVQWQARSQSFEALALVQMPPLNLIRQGGAEQIARAIVTPDLFRVFGVAPVLGRVFTAEEAGPTAEPVVILGHGLWVRLFGADPRVLGRQLAVQDGSLTIVGVAPPGLRIGTAEPDAYTPLPIDPANPGAIGGRSFESYGRLKPGVSVASARAEMATIASVLAREYEIDRNMGVFVGELHAYLVQDERPALKLLMSVVLVVLAIACANIAGLLIARGSGRRAELAVRASLGASRRRLIRQLLIESLVLAVLGGLAGLLVAEWCTRGLVLLTEGALNVNTNAPIRLDATCLLFTSAVSFTTAVLVGLIPAWQGSRVHPQAVLKQETQGGTADRGRHRMRQLLVVAEVAMALVLLAGTGLLLRTFSSLVRVDLGFQPAQTVTMGLFLGVRPAESRIVMLDRILDRVEAVPGVQAVGTVQFLPLTGMNCGTGFWFEGESRDSGAAKAYTDCALISRGYFEALGIPTLEGRTFGRDDRAGAPRVLVINRSFATRYFPGASPIGRRIFVQSSNQALAEIVGVVGDIRHNGLTTAPAPTVYLLHAQTPGYITNLVVRTNGEAAAQAEAIRHAIHEADPQQAVSSFKTMEQHVEQHLTRPRLYAVLVAAFAGLAATLAMIGVYGLIAFVVSQRGREIGIRLALGATPGQVFVSVFLQGAWLTGLGLAVGAVAALALRHVLTTFLFGVSPADPMSYLTAGVLLAVLAVAAVAIPARRAARLDPNTMLRSL